MTGAVRFNGIQTRARGALTLSCEGDLVSTSPVMPLKVLANIQFFVPAHLL